MTSPDQAASLGDLRVTDNIERNQYEAWIDEQRVGVLTYVVNGSVVTYEHTVVPKRFGGRGIASKLVEVALADARANAQSVIPQCPFVARYIDTHPKDADLLAGR